MKKYNLSIQSKQKRDTLHPFLQSALDRLLYSIDYSILEGFRAEERQNFLLVHEKTNLPWPKSKHNKFPSQGVDIVPWYSGQPQFENYYQYCYMAGRLIDIGETIAAQVPEYKNFRIRWGGNWKRDHVVTLKQKLNDLGHFEMVEVK